MSFFLKFISEDDGYALTGAGYIALFVIILAIFCVIFAINKSPKQQLKTKQLAFCAVSIALATVTSYIKFASLPMGGSITLFSMFFICFVGYLYGFKVGIATGIAYGILQLITGPYIIAPLQVLLDYPLAFGALGISGFFCNSKYGLIKGFIAGTVGRYICHVISGYIFFLSYAPDTMNPILYTLSYNATYILPEMIATIIILCIPAVNKALKQVKAISESSH